MRLIDVWCNRGFTKNCYWKCHLLLAYTLIFRATKKRSLTHTAWKAHGMADKKLTACGENFIADDRKMRFLFAVALMLLPASAGREAIFQRYTKTGLCHQSNGVEKSSIITNRHSRSFSTVCGRSGKWQDTFVAVGWILPVMIMMESWMSNAP